MRALSLLAMTKAASQGQLVIEMNTECISATGLANHARQHRRPSPRSGAHQFDTVCSFTDLPL